MGLSVHSDEHFMGEALKQAQYAFDEGEVPVGAVVVSENRIISRAYNQVERLQDVTAHAEMLAITAAQEYLGAKYLQKCSIYVTLEPCTMCAGAIYWSQIEKVVYGASDEQKGFQRLKPNILTGKTKVISGLQAEACKSLVDQFFNKVRRNN
ncbi:MAG: nucleoside deaminase [Bacteroidota bacterium]